MTSLPPVTDAPDPTHLDPGPATDDDPHAPRDGDDR
jgi:hypothetical protein